MRIHALATGLLGSVVAAALGCNGGVAFNYYDDDRPRRTHVRVDPGHVCGPGCSHYWSGDRYVRVRGHVHGPGCGHVLHDGRWILRRGGPTRVQVHKSQPAGVHHSAPAARVHQGPRKARVSPHVHGPRCGCVFDRRGSKWVVIGKDHVHGPGCGHAYIEGRWTIRY